MPPSNDIAAIIEHNKRRAPRHKKNVVPLLKYKHWSLTEKFVVTLVKTKTIVNTIYKVVFKIKRQLYQQYWWILSELDSYLFSSLSSRLISTLVWSCCCLNISCCDAKSCCCCCCCCSCISRIISLWFGPFIHSKDRLRTGIQSVSHSIPNFASLRRTLSCFERILGNNLPA